MIQDEKAQCSIYATISLLENSKKKKQIKKHLDKLSGYCLSYAGSSNSQNICNYYVTKR